MGTWRESLSETDWNRVRQNELSNDIQAKDASSMFEGYGWLDDQGQAFDPVCRLVLDGVKSYAKLLDVDEPDELLFELAYAVKPKDVILDEKGFATRFTILDDLIDLADDVLSYLTDFYFQSAGFGLGTEFIHKDDDQQGANLSFVLFRINEKQTLESSPSNTVDCKLAYDVADFVKVHNLTNTGALIPLKSRGNLDCVICSKLGQIRVPFEVAEAISKWQFDPTDENQKAAFKHLKNSERETLLTGTHGSCWDSTFGS